MRLGCFVARDAKMAGLLSVMSKNSMRWVLCCASCLWTLLKNINIKTGQITFSQKKLTFVERFPCRLRLTVAAIKTKRVVL